MRETAAARERNVLFLAAVVGEDDAPVLATDTATPENTTSGGLIWSAPTTTWDVSDLGPKSWWRAQYHYRARWYAPGILSFLERDPVGYVDGSNQYRLLAGDHANRLDPLGRESVYFRFSETLQQTHTFLVSEGIATHPLSWYGYLGPDSSLSRFPKNRASKGTAVAALANKLNPDQSNTTEQYFIGGEQWPGGGDSNIYGGYLVVPGGVLGNINIGSPPNTPTARFPQRNLTTAAVASNQVFQRLRVAQAEGVIDRLVEVAKARGSSFVSQHFGTLYRSAKLESTKNLLSHWRSFRLADSQMGLHRIVSLFATAIIRNESDVLEARGWFADQLNAQYPEEFTSDRTWSVYQRYQETPWTPSLEPFYEWNVELRPK